MTENEAERELGEGKPGRKWKSCRTRKNQVGRILKERISEKCLRRKSSAVMFVTETLLLKGEENLKDVQLD